MINTKFWKWFIASLVKPDVRQHPDVLINFLNQSLASSHRLNERLLQTNGYLARREIEGLLVPLRADPKRLEPFGAKYYSQNDEDGILQEILKRLELSPGSGIFVELGVENGLECNTHFLLHKGWSGVWFEGNGAQVQAISAKFKDKLLHGRLQVRNVFITAENIEDLLIKHAENRQIAVLSIDIDGNDYWVWKAINDVKPAIVVIEYNGKFPFDVALVQPYRLDYQWGGTDYFGASLAALVKLGIEKNYQLVGCNITGANAFFVRSDLAAGLFAGPPTAQALGQPARYHLTIDAFARTGHAPDHGPYIYL